MRRAWIAGLVVVLIAVGLSSNVRADDDALADRAQQFVVRLADKAIAQLTHTDVPLAEQERRFRAIVHDYIAFKSIARWVLGGRYWRAASEEQRQRYLKLFEDLMVATYAHRFQDYSGESLEVRGSRVIDASQALVQTMIRRPGAEKPLNIDWRVRETDGQFRIIDIMVEGLSMSQTQRSEFQSILRANGGDVDSLLDELATRLEKARDDRAVSVKNAQQPS